MIDFLSSININCIKANTLSGTTICGVNISALISICSPIVCATSCVRSPLISGATLCGSGAGLTGTASSLTVGCATNATTANNTSCLGGVVAACYARKDLANVFASTNKFQAITGTTICASTCFIGSGAGLTGTASSLTVGCATNATTAGSAPANGGTAAYSTTACIIIGCYTGGGGSQPPSYIPSGCVRLNMMNCPGNGGYYDFLMMDTYAGVDVPYVTMLGLAKQSGVPQGIIAVGGKGCAATTDWSYATLITSSNITSQNVNYATSSGVVCGTNGTNGGTAVVIGGCGSSGTHGDAIMCVWNGVGTNYAIKASPASSVCLYYAGAAKLNTHNTGICVTGCGFATDFIASSDVRLKKDITPISNALSIVENLCGVCYHMCDDVDNENRVGLIAQEVQLVLPEIVSHGKPNENDKKYGITDDKLGLKYDKLTAVLIEAIKEQQLQINELKSEIKLMNSKF